MQLWPMETSSACSENRRKPLHLLTGIFGKKSRRLNQARRDNREFGWLSQGEEDDSEDSELLQIPEPREALHSPYHARTIDQDMEHLRLSRQDNPYLQVLASRDCLYDSNDSLYEEKHLVSKENVSRNLALEHPQTLSEVHARLVRSPPPVMRTRSRNSEPSFIHLIQGNERMDSVFHFPPSHLQLPTSGAHSDRGNFHSSSPGQYSDLHSQNGRHGRFMESAVEALSARFNLSPQPRRRPKDHLLNSFIG